MSAPIDLRPDHAKLVRDILAKHLPAGVSVRVFGSRAKWTAKTHSDLDLALKGAERLPPQVIAALAEAFEESALPFKVDVLDWRAVASEFQAVIERDGVEFDWKCARLWRMSNWGTEVSLEYGKAIRDYSTARGEYRVFGSNGPIGWTDRSLTKGPGIILGRKGAYRGIKFSKEPFFVIDTAYYVVPKTQLDMRWLYYAIVNHKLGEIDDGSPIPSTTRAAVYVRDLEVPPPDEQIGISSVLGALDDKIELNRRMNETLEAMARAIFKDWFVDFGPTRAKMEGRAPYLAPDIWSIFPDRLDDEGKPEGWSEASLTRFFEIVGGGTPKTSEPSYWDGNIPWFSVADTPAGSDTFVFETENYITDHGLQNSSARLLDAGHTIISARGTVGNLAMAGRPMAFNQSCYGLKGANGYGPCFVFLAAQHMVSKLQSLAHGSVFSTITRQTFDSVHFPAPGIVIAEQFEIAACALFGRIRANVAESRTLAATRDLLLPKLMSGEVRVREASAAVERLYAEGR